jgi:hypothetical protein
MLAQEGMPSSESRCPVRRYGDRTRFTVHDPGAGPLPEMLQPAEHPGPGGGHGLRLVEAISDRWGVERGSTRVWFETGS